MRLISFRSEYEILNFIIGELEEQKGKLQATSIAKERELIEAYHLLENAIENATDDFADLAEEVMGNLNDDEDGIS